MNQFEDNEQKNEQQEIYNTQNNILNNIPDNMQQTDTMPNYESYGYDIEQSGMSPKKIITRTGLALFVFILAIFAASNVGDLLANLIYPKVIDTDWYVWALNAFAIVGVGFPIYFMLMKKIPDSNRGEVVKMKPSRFLLIFFICAAAMYITNFMSSILTIAIAYLKGDTELLNPAAEAILNSNYYISLIYASIIAPIIEELIFRKVLLDKLRRYGDIPAILLTGLAFGLFHMNLPQFFYAAVLGFIFAYVTIRTNTVKYAIILHMMINFIGTAVTPLVTSGNIIGSLFIVLWVLTAVSIGTVFFIVNIKNIRLEKSVPLLKKSEYLLNTGSILYIVACLVVIVINTLAL